MSKSRKSRKPPTRRLRLGDICRALQAIAPLHLAQSWDNVGLLAGDESAAAKRALLTIDLTPEVAEEAVRRRADLVVAYHPPIFKPITRLTASSSGAESVVLRCLNRSIAVYSPHTALDAAPGGTNDVLAGLCGLVDVRPLETISPDAGAQRCKLVVFVPPERLERVAAALFDAGAGIIGEYSRCGFRLRGQGTFLGSAESHPVVGKSGVYETVDEIRLETVCPAERTAAVVAALRSAHPYEEPAFDLYPLQAEPQPGCGRVGRLPRPVSVVSLARRLRKALQASSVPGVEPAQMRNSLGVNAAQIVGPGPRIVDRAVVVVGAAGTLPFAAGLGPTDVVVTGEIRHHDALAILRRDSTAIALNHWTSERPTLPVLAARLRELVPEIEVLLSQADREPFTAI